jgi:uncharacterized protein YhjY with autotransporter beta-barrel domain
MKNLKISECLAKGAALVAFFAATGLRAEVEPADVAAKSPPNVWWTGTGTGGYFDPQNWRWAEGTSGQFPYGMDMWVGLGTDVARANRTIDIISDSDSDLTIAVDNVRYYDIDYVMNIQGRGAGRMIFNFTGLGIIRDNSNTVDNPAWQNLPDIIIRVKENATLRYNGSGQVTSSNWYNAHSRVFLEAPTSELDMSEVTGNYAFNQIQAVAGSVIRLPNTNNTLTIGGGNLPMIIDGDILGGSGSNTVITKNGGGTLYLNGSVTGIANGRLQIGAGGVIVNGLMDCYVRATAGFISGSGTIASTVEINQNNASVYISGGADAAQVGTLTITKNLLLGEFNGVYVDLAGSGANARADKIIVGGTTSWGNAYVMVRPADDFEMTANRFIILESGALNPDSVWQAPNKNLINSLTLRAAIYQDGSNIMLSLEQLSFSNDSVLPGLGENQKQIAGHIDRLIATGGEEVNKLLDGLNRVYSINMMRYAMAQLSPMGLRTWYPSLVLLSADISDNLSERRHVPFDGGGGKWEVFAAGSFLGMGFEQTGEADIANANGSRLMGGVSYNFNQRIKAGLFYSKDTVDGYSDGYGGSTKIDGDTLGVFGEYRGKNFRASAAVFTSSDDYTTNRSLGLAGGGYSSGRSDGSRVGAHADVAYDIAFKNFTMAPFAGIQYMDWSVDEFAERTSTLPLTVHSLDATSLLGKAGVRVSTDTKVFKRPLRPFINLGYKREFGDSSYTMRVTQGGSSYAMKLQDPEGGMFARLGAELVLGKRFALQAGAGYDNSVHTTDNYSFHAALGRRF